MSFAVNGWPSCHVASFRIVNVHVRPSGDCVQAVARPGDAARLALSKLRSRSKFRLSTSYSGVSSAFQGLTVLMSFVVPSTKSIDPPDPDALLEVLALCASAVPANDIARRVPSAAMPTTTRRPLFIPCLPSMAPCLLPLVLRASAYSGLVDRQGPGVGVEGGRDPQGDRGQVFPVTEGQLV